MPLIARCRDCGQEVKVKEIREVKWSLKASGAFIIIYDCLKCKLTILEEIYKREW
jgi:DNA-directed RNA polymerase subunit RPC12/RpoP